MSTMYTELISKVDRLSASLAECYSAHLVCRAGCSGCCQHHISVFPVEAAQIRAAYMALPEHLRQQILFQAQRVEVLESLGEDLPVACPMLVGNVCAVYSSRPLICRTQGLPLLYENEAGEKEVDFCPLNFTAPGAIDDLEEDSLMPLDELNLQLAGINWQFCQEQGIDRSSAGERIRMSRIILGPCS